MPGDAGESEFGKVEFDRGAVGEETGDFERNWNHTWNYTLWVSTQGMQVRPLHYGNQVQSFSGMKEFVRFYEIIPAFT